MKKLLLLSAIAACSVSLISCGNSQGYASKAPTSTPANTSTSATNSDNSTPQTGATKSEKIASNSTKNSAEKFPEIVTVRGMRIVNSGCILTLEAPDGQRFDIGAGLKECENEAAFLNQKVRAGYEQGISEDTGRIVVTTDVIVTSLELLNAPTPEASSQTLTNGEWTIGIGNMNSWSGVNGTGNVMYEGCDSQSNCINLDQGKVSCRDGLCVTSWQNGDYTYAMESPMSDRADTAQTTLIVRKGDTEILRETGFRVVAR